MGKVIEMGRVQRDRNVRVVCFTDNDEKLKGYKIEPEAILTVGIRPYAYNYHLNLVN